ncbi:hypothetical protein ABH925_007108 [Streptacidiphilus sp. EB129]
MTVTSRAQLIAALAAKQPAQLIGTRESDWVDFKSAHPDTGPYDLGTDKGKYELAKDVAAFANAGGGLIACGFKATQKPTEIYESASRAVPFDKKLIKPGAYKDTITARQIRPASAVGQAPGISATWFSSRRPRCCRRPGCGMAAATVDHRCVKTEDHALAAGHSVDPDRWQESFEALMARVAGRFVRMESRRRVRRLVLGLLAYLPRKN